MLYRWQRAIIYNVWRTLTNLQVKGQAIQQQPKKWAGDKNIPFKKQQILMVNKHIKIYLNPLAEGKSKIELPHYLHLPDWQKLRKWKCAGEHLMKKFFSYISGETESL